MPTTNARGHLIPSATDTSVSRATIFQEFGESIRDVVPTANTTARSALVTALVAAGEGPSSTRPLVVYRHDAPGLSRLEWTVDGSVWVPGTGILSFANDAARDSWTTSNVGYLSTGDACVSAGTSYTWSGTAWQNNTLFLTGLGNQLVGSAPTLANRLLVQAGTRAGTANVASVLATTFATPFPNGVLTVLATPADASTTTKQVVSTAWTVNGFDGQCLNGSGSGIGAVATRYNWIAIGW